MHPSVEALRNEKYFSLETFKKDGNGVKTPVWFAELDGRFFVFTDGTSFKVKRIGRNPRGRFAACDMRGTVHGPWFDSTCETVESPELVARVYEALKKRYGLMFSLLTIGAKLSGSIKRRKIIGVTPA